MSLEGRPPYEEEIRPIGEVLKRDAVGIMERWLERAIKEQVHAEASEREKAMNDLVKMLQSLGGILQAQSAHALEHATNVARDHGRQRSGLGWTIVHVARDYEILHTVVLEHMGEVMRDRFTNRQATVLATVFERAMGSAVEAYSQIAEQRWEEANRKLEEKVKEEQAALRRVTLDLTEAEHAERQRIAKTLHDDFQQILIATRMRLQSIMRDPAPNPAALQEMNGLLDQMLHASRDLSVDLYPAVLEARSLPGAIRWLGESFQERHNLMVTVDLQVPEQGNPGPKALRRLVYDAVRELLFNIVKHGKTDRAEVRISKSEELQWRFEVADRGVGFSYVKMDPPATPTGLGLSSLRHRIEQIGGAVEVDSEPGRGTRIVLEVPMEAEAGSEEQSV